MDEIEAPVLVAVRRHEWNTSVRRAEALVSGFNRAAGIGFEDDGRSPRIEEHERVLSVVGARLAAQLSRPTRNGDGREPIDRRDRPWD
ncbi:MAG: hypothetical protein M3Q10_10590 [Chloroflexota bacterium]|nr:hypothetical protein [Chloroflexota bacterium]